MNFWQKFIGGFKEGWQENTASSAVAEPVIEDVAEDAAIETATQSMQVAQDVEVEHKAKGFWQTLKEMHEAGKEGWNNPPQIAIDEDDSFYSEDDDDIPYPGETWHPEHDSYYIGKY